MKRALAVLLAAWLLFAAAAAEGTELEIVYFPQGGFRFVRNRCCCPVE